MQKTRRVIKIFLGSPGDLNDEREAAFRVVEEVNKNHADFWGCQVELVGWEDTLPRFGRPQEIINQDLEQCEYFLGMMWKRWGTPPDKQGKYSSGFEEEFSCSLDRRKREGVPEIALLFKEVSSEWLEDPNENLKQVLKFKSEIIENKELLFYEFKERKDFEVLVRRIITQYVQKKLDLEWTREGEEEKRPLTKSDQGGALEEAADQEMLVAGPSRRLVAELLQKSNSWDAINPESVARFRLVALGLHRDGNDDAVLGVHDNNILFAHRDKLSLGKAEVRGLVKSGLEYFSASNVPLWYWINKAERNHARELVYHSITGTDVQRTGAIGALKLLGAQISDFSDRIKRKDVILWWVDARADKQIQTAALKYLRDFGLPEDEEAIEPLLSSEDSSIRSAAVHAYLSIVLRSGRDAALYKLIELQADPIDDDLLSCMFETPEGIRTELLSNCLSHRNDHVRLSAVRALRERKQLDREAASKLTEDPEAEIRFIALCQLADVGAEVSEHDARKTLVRENRAGGLGGLIMGAAQVDREGLEFWEAFRRTRLSKLSEAELRKKCSNSSIFEWDACLVRFDVYFKRCSPELRRNLKDSFESAFEDKIVKLQEMYAEESAFMSDAKRLKESIRVDVVKSALEILCARYDAEDLDVVRHVLDDDLITFSSVVVKYLGKCGSWGDVQRVARLLEKPDYRGSRGLLGNDRSQDFSISADAVCRLGRRQPGDLITATLSKPLWRRVVIQMPKATFASLGDDMIFSLLDTDNERMRLVVVLKCVACLSKSRLRKLMLLYSSKGDGHYYNVIHWLDFGLSLPASQVKHGATQMLRAL